MAYNDFDIELARRAGAPEPEENAARGNAIIQLVNADRLDEARSRLDQISDPVIRRDLETLIDFHATSLCLPRD